MDIPGMGDTPVTSGESSMKRVYEARLVNEANGEYKGYMLNRDEWPEGIEGLSDVS